MLGSGKRGEAISNVGFVPKYLWDTLVPRAGGRERIRRPPVPIPPAVVRLTAATGAFGLKGDGGARPLF